MSEHVQEVAGSSGGERWKWAAGALSNLKYLYLLYLSHLDSMLRGVTVGLGTSAPHNTVKSLILNAWDRAVTVNLTLKCCLDFNLKQLLDFSETVGQVFFFSSWIMLLKYVAA